MAENFAIRAGEHGTSLFTLFRHAQINTAAWAVIDSGNGSGSESSDTTIPNLNQDLDRHWDHAEIYTFDMLGSR